MELFDRLFGNELLRAFETARVLFESNPGRDFLHESQAVADRIRDRIDIEADYAALAVVRSGARLSTEARVVQVTVATGEDLSRPQRMLRGLQERKGIAIVVAVAIVIVEVGSLTEALQHVTATITGTVARLEVRSSPESSMLSVSVPQGLTFASAAAAIARLDSKSVDLSLCPHSLGGLRVEAGMVRAPDHAGLIGALKGRLGRARPVYTVKLDQHRGVYEVTCE